jgi:N utilization substance protein A
MGAETEAVAAAETQAETAETAHEAMTGEGGAAPEGAETSAEGEPPAPEVVSQSDEVTETPADAPSDADKPAE